MVSADHSAAMKRFHPREQPARAQAGLAALKSKFCFYLRSGKARLPRVARARFEQIQIVAQIVHLLPKARKLSPHHNRRSRSTHFFWSANHRLAFNV